MESRQLHGHLAINFSFPKRTQYHTIPQASLRDYFRNDYKGGGVFKHEAYEHHPDEWCWIHKSSGIKARDRSH